jgi:flavin reductase (DIM6/NTAB) family NADH-FMN oxidoreductase RutF/2-polyprenyl-6-methoxyphenol hydroxylase-like FAD-dependent oxidoreductase
MGRRIAIVGAGQSGLQLGLGLLSVGHAVTLVSNRSPGQVQSGPVQSSQCMFDSALASERAMGLDFWSAECPPVEGIAFTTPGPSGSPTIKWAARLDRPAQSVDQRVKLSGWMTEFERRGGTLVVREAGVGDLEALAREHELTIVATGRGPLGALFALDEDKSPDREPMRALALTYVRGMAPRPEYSAVSFNLIPEVGEYFVFPALTTTGPCEIMVFEGIPGGPMDRWDDVRTPAEHLARSLELLERFFPWEHARCEAVELTDEQGILVGRFPPTVRRPVAGLPSGARVLAMADAAVLNDPLTGQGSNNAAKCAEIYLERILSQGRAVFDEEWMVQTFDHYWLAYAKWVVSWTNAMLAPPAHHVLRLVEAAQTTPTLASTIVNGFDDPRTLFPWWVDAEAADGLIAEKRAEQARGLDLRDLRDALGQFATGVTIITTQTADGLPVGITANSFSSLSLEPPLVLWCLALTASSLPVFRDCKHFAVNVLSSGQHHLSRLFATSGADKFAGTEVRDGPLGVPLMDGALAHFVCRNVRQIEAGDHLIVIGEVQHYQVFDGEPLVFHSGSYRVATRHPELEPR